MAAFEEGRNVAVSLQRETFDSFLRNAIKCNRARAKANESQEHKDAASHRGETEVQEHPKHGYRTADDSDTATHLNQTQLLAEVATSLNCRRLHCSVSTTVIW